MIASVVSKPYPQWLAFWFTLEWVSELKNDFGAFTAKNKDRSGQRAKKIWIDLANEQKK